MSAVMILQYISSQKTECFTLWEKIRRSMGSWAKEVSTRSFSPLLTTTWSTSESQRSQWDSLTVVLLQVEDNYTHGGLDRMVSSASKILILCSQMFLSWLPSQSICIFRMYTAQTTILSYWTAKAKFLSMALLKDSLSSYSILLRGTQA